MSTFSELWSQVPPHDPQTCTREHCGRCKPSGEPRPPKPVDHQAAKPKRPVGRRERDLGRLAQEVGKRIEDEGQAASTHFAEWEREGQIPPTPPPCPLCDGDGCEGCNGSGDAQVASSGALLNHRAIREASQLRGRWLKARVRLEAALYACDMLLDLSKAVAEVKPGMNRTAAQVESMGWCGSCWKSTGELVPVTLRPSGEPYYKGRCRFCGSWPGGDPPKDVLETRHAGKAVRVKAS